MTSGELLQQAGQIEYGNRLIRPARGLNFDIIVNEKRLSEEEEEFYRIQLDGWSDERISAELQNQADAKKASDRIKAWSDNNPYMLGDDVLEEVD